MTVTLHYLDNSRAIRILWLLEELKIPYKTKVYFRNPKTRLAPPSLAEVHPSGTAPVIEDDGEVIAESGNIMEYLVTKYGQNTGLIWHNESEKQQIKYALYAAEGNIFITMFMMSIHQYATTFVPWPLSYLFKLLFHEIDRRYAEPMFGKCMLNLQSELEKNGGYYCSGRLTVADIIYQGTLELFIQGGYLTNVGDKYPGIQNWLDRLEAGPGYKAARAKQNQLERKRESNL